MSALEYHDLDDTVYFYFGSNDTSGSGDDGTSAACDVRLAGAAASAAPVYSPTPDLLTHANYPAGAYEVAIAATTGNGFAAGNTYAVFCTLTVDSQNPTGFVGKFKLDKQAVDTVQWDGTDVATPDTAGHPKVTIKDGTGTGEILLTSGKIDEVSTLTGHTAQTGDNYARLGAPAGASVSADIASVQADTGAIEADTQDIQSRLPAALVGGRVDANVGAISGDVTAADNLESQYDSTGLTGDNFPATQAQIGSLAVGAGGISVTAESATITTGTETLSYTATHSLDGSYHELEPSGGNTDFYYQFDVGVTGKATEVIWDGYVQSNLDSVAVYGYDWVAAAWSQVGTIAGANGTTDKEEVFVFTTNMTGTAANVGKVRCRFDSTTSTKVATDRILCEYTSMLESAFILHSGVAQGGESNSITLDASANTNDDFYNHARVVISSGTGDEQERIIVDYDGTTKVATIAPPWKIVPDTTSAFEIEPATTHAETGWATIKVGVIQAATSTTATLDSTASSTDDFYNNELIHIDYGTGEGQVRVITDYDGTTKVATINAAWTILPDTTSEYIVEEAHPYIDTLLSSVESKVDTVDSNVDAILVDTGTTIPAQITALNDLSAADVNAEVDTALADYDPPTKAELDARTLLAASYATAANQSTIENKIDTVDSNVDSILVDTGTTIPAQITALNDLSAADVNAEVDTALTDIHLPYLFAVDYNPASKPGVATALLNELVENDGGVSRFTANALEQSPGGVSSGYAADYSGAVWVDEENGTSTGTTAGTDATWGNRSDDFDNAQTVAESIGIKEIQVTGRNAITLSDTLEGYTVYGNNSTLNGGSQTVTSSIFYDFYISGTFVFGVSGNLMEFRKCIVNSATLDSSVLYDCGLNAVTIEATLHSWENIRQSAIAAPSINFQSGAARLYINGYSGNLTINNLASGSQLYIRGKSGGDLILNGADATVQVSGVWGSITNNMTGSPTYTNTAINLSNINTEMLDVLTVDTFPEPSAGAPPATTTLANKIGYPYKAWRNKSTSNATTYELYNDDGITVDHQATLSDDGITFTRGEMEADS